MSENDSLDGVQEHYGQHYQRTAEIESASVCGLSFEDRAQKEAAFALRSSRLSFEDEDRILDLACGAGEQAMAMSRILENDYGARTHIDARDFSPELIDAALSKQRLATTQAGIRDRMDFAMGDMGHIQESLKEGQRYKLITILGNSFMYLRSKEAHVQALRDLHELIAPGGRLVIQFREGSGQRDPEQWSQICDTLGVTPPEVVDDPEARLRVNFSTKDRDSFYFKTIPPTSHPSLVDLIPRLDASGRILGYSEDGNPPFEYTARYDNDGELSHFEDEDGIEHFGFLRTYVDEDDDEHEMSPTYIIDYMSEKAVPVLQQMMMDAGFRTTRLEQETLSPNGSVQQFAIVAEK